MYQVGFGDCFLLTFGYAGGKDRHVLIDFGSTKAPRGVPKDHMTRVAKDIVRVCGGKLTAVVATHRHRDHISGFATGAKSATGNLIAACNPDFVIQPWTEDPRAKPNALEATLMEGGQSLSAEKHFLHTLEHMHAVAGVALDAARSVATFDVRAGEALSFLGEDNLQNRKAVDNLATMGSAQVKRRYAKFGDELGLEKVLPGVKVRVLGPPSLKQSETIRKQRDSDPTEFWQLQERAWSVFGREARARRSGSRPIFGGRKAVHVSEAPPGVRWFISKMQNVNSDLMLELVRSLDRAMNNTSLILLVEVGSKRLLFPGDAQIENWAYALSHQATRDLLKSVDLYKVGHHGSRNATPQKSLWPLFERRASRKMRSRMTTVVSTLAGKHGHEDSQTEVPRQTLIAALEKDTNFLTTERLGRGQLCHVVPIDVR
jgi:hypothetical protein